MIYVTQFPAPKGHWRISAGGGVQPRWRADGRELFYLAPPNQLMSVALELDTARDAAKVRSVTPLFFAPLSGSPRGPTNLVQHQVDDDPRH